MNEQLLHFIWQLGYFNLHSLESVNGEAIQIIHPGYPNTNQGPDFARAKIRIGTTTWAGTVELHLKTSDWDKHQHGSDKNYGNVILHVVYEHDRDAQHLPTLELKTRISRNLLNHYRELMESRHFIPCEPMIAGVDSLTLTACRDRMVAERLTRKSAQIKMRLSETNDHWEETFWWLLARTFGSDVNGDAFAAVAKSLPVSVLARHKNQLHQLEALLLGQAGLLNDKFEDPYPAMLQKEFNYLKSKYKLASVHHPVHFLRMRPANFPTLRLAQLAVLVHHSLHLFSRIVEEDDLSLVRKWFDVEANDFWYYHYKLDDASAFRKKVVGETMINHIIINALVPVLFTYGEIRGIHALRSRALRWLEEAKAENNRTTRGFMALGMENKSAYDSQAWIELKAQYCDLKKCLQCTVGNRLLKKHIPSSDVPDR